MQTAGPLRAALVGAALCGVAVSAQSPGWLKPAGRVTVRVTVEPVGKPGSADVVLLVDATPAAGIHVYAPGNTDYIRVEVEMDATPGITPGAAIYPPSEPFVFGELRETVKVYQKPFRIRQRLSIDAAARARPLTISGSLRYQACTDTVCYRPESQPFSIVVPARPSPAKGRT